MSTHSRPQSTVLLVIGAFIIGASLLLLFSGPGGAPAKDTASSDDRNMDEPERVLAEESADIAAGTDVEPSADDSALENQEQAFLNVVGKVPVDGESLSGQIILFFDRSLDAAPYDVEGSRPFTIYPEVQGDVRVSNNFILFKGRFDQTATYELTLSPDLRSLDGHALNPEQGTQIFAPFQFAPTRVWLLEKTAERIVLGLNFPAAVDAATVADGLKVTGADGVAEIPVTIEPATNAQTLRLAIQGIPSLPITVHVAAGVSDVSKHFTTASDTALVFPEEPDLAVTHLDWGDFYPENQYINIGFSQAVPADDLKSLLTITDENSAQEIPFEITTTGEDSQHTLMTTLEDTVSVQLSVRIQPGLKGAGFAELREAYANQLTRSPQPLVMDYSWWNQSGREGLAYNIGFNHELDPEALKEHLEITPAVANIQVRRPYGRRIEILGDWDSNTEYTLTIKTGMPYADGTLKLVEEVTQTAYSESVPSFVGFDQPGKFYFPRRSESTLYLESRNVDKARITLHRVFPSNIAVALSDMNDGEGSYPLVDRWSEEVGSVEIPLNTPKDRLGRSAIDLKALFPSDLKGVFCLEAEGFIKSETQEETVEEGEDEYENEEPAEDADGYYSAGYTGYKLALFTDIGILSHWSNSELALFTHHLGTLAPLSGANVTVYSYKNQVLANAQADGSGIVHVKPFQASLGEPTLAAVELGGDFAFLELMPRTDDTPEITADMPDYEAEAYDAFVYADRDIYRPGETAHIRWIVRMNYGDAVANVPLLYTVVQPNGQTLIEGPTTLSDSGTGGVDIPTEKSYATGNYTISVFVPGDDVAIGDYTFKVEEFVPNRMKSTVSLNDPFWVAGTEYEFVVNAQHLAGPPAGDRKTEAKIILKRDEFRPEGWTAFRFGNDDDYQPDLISLGEAMTDAEGNASYSFTYTPEPNVTFPVQATVLGRVFEMGGRPASGLKEIGLFPSNICLGVTASGSANGDVTVEVAAVQPDGKAASLNEMKVTLEREEWNYYVRRYYDSHESNWTKIFSPVTTKSVALSNGRGALTFPMGSEWGYFRLRVHSEATQQYSTISFYAYGGQVSLVDAAQPSLIKLTLDKKEYAVGDEAVLRVEAPFDGKAVVVMQGEAINRMVTADVVQGVGEVRFTVDKSNAPNVWLEATVVHPIEDGRAQVYPFSSFALANVIVRDPARAIQVRFPTLPDEVRPAQAIEVDLETLDYASQPVSTEVTLALVDEGIHTITGYTSPDPLAHLSRSRKPDYRRAHFYDKIAYDFEKPEAGGDIEALLGRRAAAIGDNWIKPLALWSGTVQTDATGRAKVTFELPEFDGQVRLVAVAATGSAVGAKDDYMFVRRPFSLQTSMPRFLLPGDTASCRAVMYNRTPNAATALVSWTTEGVLNATSGSKELELAPNSEISTLVDFAAGASTGQGVIQWYAVVKDATGTTLENLAFRAPIPVRSPAAYQTSNTLVVLEPGKTETFRNDVYEANQLADLQIVAGASPYLRLADALKYVAHYPYGCVEQTTSALMPMYLLRKSEPLVRDTLKEQPLDSYIQAGIDRLMSMQTVSGGLGTWPGSSSPYPYGSVYALHFLTMVKNDREFRVPEDNFAKLQQYVRGAIDESASDTFSDLYLRCYATYVLSMGGDLEAIQQIERFDGIAIPRTARLLLGAALAMNTKDTDRVKMYLAEKPTADWVDREYGTTLNSDIRATAVELLARKQTGETAAALHDTASKLMAFFEKQRYGNTQETAFVITALVSYMAEITENIDKAAANIVSTDGEAGITGANAYSTYLQGPDAEVTVANTGATPIYVSVTAGGLPKDAPTEAVANGVGIRRLVMQNGEPREATALTAAQTDSVIFALEITCDRAMENVVVVDLLAAGLEIENPRLEADASALTVPEGAATPSYFDVRDDRMVFAFDTLEAGKHMLYYAARAVTPGTYQHPPVVAECMYDASLHGHTVPGTVEIK